MSSIKSIIAIIKSEFKLELSKDTIFFLELINEHPVSKVFLNYNKTKIEKPKDLFNEGIKDVLISFSNTIENDSENLFFNNRNLKYDIVDMNPVTWQSYSTLRHFISPNLLCFGLFEHGNLCIDKYSSVYYHANDVSDGDYELERTPKIANSLTEFLDQLIQQNKDNPEIYKLQEIYEKMIEKGFK